MANMENVSGAFQSEGFINKKGEPNGERAMFNLLPPGDMIDQTQSDIREMPMKKITALGYPGSGQAE